MMKIGVISDTHVPRRRKTLPEKVYEIFEGVDLILHAGDILVYDVLDELSSIARVEAVYGNNDGDELRIKLPKRRIIEAEGFKIGLIHGDGEKGVTKTRAIEAFEDDQVQCIVFGHSHIPYNALENGVLLFNPGSPVDKRRQIGYSVGLLHLQENIIGEIVYF